MEDLLSSESGKFYTFCQEYGIDPQTIKFDENSIIVVKDRVGNPIEDIRTIEENTAFANLITSFIRDKAEDTDTILHCSVAGGRKTMSIYMAYALQLFGRPQDTLSHVLVSEGFESHPEFFYIQKKCTSLKSKI